jgi:hypothetical protein
MSSVVQLDAERARRLTDQIKVTVEGAWQLITEAYESRAWAALGYSSWDDYCTREFGTARLKLPREERQEVVASLREQGMSTRAIAAATGVHHSTVADDLQPGVGFPTPAVPATSAPRAVTGTDGKTYKPRPNPAQEKLVAQAKLDAYDESLSRLQPLMEHDPDLTTGEAWLAIEAAS